MIFFKDLLLTLRFLLMNYVVFMLFLLLFDGLLLLSQLKKPLSNDPPKAAV